MSRSIIRFLGLLAISAAVLSTAFGGGEKLRYAMAKGSSVSYTLTGDTKSHAQMMGQDFTTTSWNFFGITMKVEDVGPTGSLTFIGTIDTNFAKIDSPMMKDTARVVTSINGKRVRVTVSPIGKTLTTATIDSIPPSPGAQMGGVVNPADIMRRLFIELPENEVGVGESWKQTTPDTTDAGGFKMISKPDVTYKVLSSEKKGGYDCYKITFEGTASQYGTGSRQGMELVVDGTVKTSGTFYFAPKNGILVWVNSTSSSDSNISGTGEQMFTATQTVNTSSTMELVR